jgi:ATP adenylyltransferase
MTMNLQTHSVTAEGRFAALLGDWPLGNQLHDQLLMETSEWVVAPTLGAIVPQWLIAVPRHAALNYKSWQRTTGQNPAAIVARVGEHLGLSKEQLIWFEHGPRDVGTAIGCGVDYAHLHILFDLAFSFDALIGQVRTAAALSWRSCTPDVAYAQLTGDNSYLVLSSGDRTIFAEDVDAIGSQFLRRMIAATAGVGDDWDYKRHPHHENIALTVSAFRARAHSETAGG